jgi:hypothetical protein
MFDFLFEFYLLYILLTYCFYMYRLCNLCYVK